MRDYVGTPKQPTLTLCVLEGDRDQKQVLQGCDRPMQYQDIITIEPSKRGGKPCLRGVRITCHMSRA
ncbi:MAG: hypothetical protein WBG38_06875 [Nodosilinea sp.]